MIELLVPLPLVRSGERQTVFLKFSPAEDAYRKNHAERAVQYEGIDLRGIAALDHSHSIRIWKMLSRPSGMGPRL